MKEARTAFARWIRSLEEEATVHLPANHSFPSHKEDAVAYALEFVQRLASANDVTITRFVFNLGPLCQLAVTIHFEHGQRLILVF
jgi:hypothetical protein